MSAVGCCGQPPCVVVATARCRVPTAQHSTHFHFLTFPLPGGGWCGLTRPAPRACTRTTALHLAHLGAGKRTGAQCGAAEAQCAGTSTLPSHTLAPHSQLSLPSHFHWARCTVGTQWMVLLLVGGGGRIHFQNTVNTEYAANFWRGRLVVVRAIFAVISSTL